MDSQEPELARLARHSAYAALTMAAVCGASVVPLLLLGMVGLPTVWVELSGVLATLRWLPLSSVVAICASVVGLGAAGVMAAGGACCAFLGAKALRSVLAAEREARLVRASQQARAAAWKRTGPMRESSSHTKEPGVRARVVLEPQDHGIDAPDFDAMTPVPDRNTRPFATLERRPVSNH